MPSSIEITDAVGEDGVNCAVAALKDVARTGTSSERIHAAALLLQYGNVSFDAFGNEQRR